MSDKSNQQISNLMDGELEFNASKFLLKRMAADESLSKTWENYHLIKSCLQKKPHEPLVVDIASKVSQKLQGQNITVGKIEPKLNRWLKPVLGVGIAASVAFLSVFMLQNQQVNTPTATILANNAVPNPIIKPMIQPSLASAGKTFVPPPSLSRYPSLSTKNNYSSNQVLSQSMGMPYLIIINQKAKQHNLSPMKIKDLSD